MNASGNTTLLATAMLLGALGVLGCEDKADTAAGDTKAGSSAKPSAKASGSGAKGEGKAADGGTAGLEAKCAALGKACGKSDKWQKQIVEQCNEPLASYAKAGCGEQLAATLACYEKDICSGEDEVRAMRDFKLLSKRTKKCVEATAALDKCLPEKKDEGDEKSDEKSDE